MKNLKLMRPLVAIIPLFVGACATTGSDAGKIYSSDPTMSEYVASSPEARSEADARLKEITEVADQYRQTRYQSGKPVEFGTEEAYYTTQWVKSPVPGAMSGLILLYPGRYPGSLSIETQGVIAVAADAEGRPQLFKDQFGNESPKVVAANFSTQEGNGRMWLKLGTQVLASSVNGAVAAGINTSFGSCQDGCGNAGVTLVNEVISTASALSQSEAQALQDLRANIGAACASQACLAE